MTSDARSPIDLMIRDEKQHKRLSIWLWLYLQEHLGAKFDPTECNTHKMQEATSRYVEESSELSDSTIQDAMASSLVSAEHFEWIDNDKRQIRWLLVKLEGLTGFNHFDSFPHLLGRDRLVAMFDIWSKEITLKIKDLEGLRRDWLHHKNRDLQFKWFEDKKEGGERCRFASQWLKNDKQFYLRRLDPFDDHLGLVMFFDDRDLRERERKDIVQSIRRSWNRQKYLERLKGKKQYNFILSEKVIELLDSLAESHDMKRPEVLETLISMEFKEKTYLNKKRKVSE